MTNKGCTDRAHILLVDDDERIRTMLDRYLRSEGFRVSLADGGQAMRDVLGRDAVDLVLLDIMLPGEDGLLLAQEVRSRGGIGIIMLTGRGDLVDRVIGLEIGADDYIPKPFHLREVLARVKSVLRRMKGAEQPADQPSGSDPAIIFEGWRFNSDRRELTDPHGHVVPLTTGEFNLLATFIRNPGRVLNRDQLMDMTRGRTWEAFDRTIDAQVARLRKKIEIDPKHPRFIKAVRGVGYVFTANSLKLLSEVDTYS